MENKIENGAVVKMKLLGFTTHITTHHGFTTHIVLLKSQNNFSQSTDTKPKEVTRIRKPESCGWLIPKSTRDFGE